MWDLVRSVQSGDCLTDSLSSWLTAQDGRPRQVTHELVSERVRPVTQAEARRLDLPVNSDASYRHGSLWVNIDGAERRIAVANALVVRSRLPWLVIEELGRGVPLGVALQAVGVRRLTDEPVFIESTDESGATVVSIHLRATLVVGGCPLALTDEVLEQCVFEHMA
jgi:hypothetical protein